MKEVEAIVLAGGYGRRMGEITKNQQKCLLPVEGKPILAHVLDSLVNAFGSVDLKVAVAYKAGQVKDYLDRNRPPTINVTYISHRPGIETWSIYNGMAKYIKGAFVGLPGDLIASPNAYASALELFENLQPETVMTFSPLVAIVDTHGVGKIDNQKVIEFQFPPPEQLDLDHLRDMNIYAGNKNFFRLLKRYPFPRRALSLTFVHAVLDGRDIAGNRYEEGWRHIGYPEDLIR